MGYARSANILTTMDSVLQRNNMVSRTGNGGRVLGRSQDIHKSLGKLLVGLAEPLRNSEVGRHQTRAARENGGRQRHIAAKTQAEVVVAAIRYRTKH